MATLLNEKALDGAGQNALINLLDGEASSLGELAEDGNFKPELYPDDNTNKIIASMLWKTLGSHNAKDRWRAAHSIRCFAKFNRWEVISEVVNLIERLRKNKFSKSTLGGCIIEKNGSFVTISKETKELRARKIHIQPEK